MWWATKMNDNNSCDAFIRFYEKWWTNEQCYSYLLENFLLLFCSSIHNLLSGNNLLKIKSNFQFSSPERNIVWHFLRERIPLIYMLLELYVYYYYLYHASSTCGSSCTIEKWFFLEQFHKCELCERPSMFNYLQFYN